MEAVIGKWGNSPALRLPVAAMKEANLHMEQKVNLVITQGRIVIEPSNKVTYSLDDLLSGVNSTNLHGEVSFGPPVGNEVL
jgi:antitoxin MazE